MRRMSPKIKHINKKTEIIKKDQVEIVDLKIMKTEMTNLLQEL